MSLCTADVVYYQGSDDVIHGSLLETEGTYPFLDSNFVIADALPSTKLACTSATPYSRGGVRLFFQTSAGNIVEYSRNTLDAQWSYTTLPTNLNTQNKRKR